MIDEWEWIWKETVIASSKFQFGIYLEGLRESTKNLSRNSRCPSLDSSLTPLAAIDIAIALIYIVSSGPMLGGYPCHHGMARPRVADGRDGLQLEVSCEYIE
jgi:hypothetical protein